MAEIRAIDTLGKMGYEGPFTTECSRVIDELLKESREMYSGKLNEYMPILADNIFVTKAEEILSDGVECLYAVRLILKHEEELLVLFPWPKQYEQGACIALYQKGAIDELEIDMILVQLIELIELGEIKNEQKYLM
ncbi:MAG: hypothetical protein UX49_C0044G0005 [Candidatus Wolfebacteria bacterium GW2011_GWC2_46_275]|uniref:Uncharacterized protein n=2 Tax=Candidatus Wolfeibacteriota TaxID=1752735 RepID=A0A0G1U6Y4_9BACT|nr:MAG: hypothetical protein UX70_C0001G0955 [Candidatus Wolfebacteria bacterium GW2011_GWB1_47_1]KKU34492.1 MAG: hypothetical protein UX49_C0044G0005 [Candidatus Wolfebacteria bacterium GW2011_GWC2_46_275]KKU53204.1 MAG: hypothetical protein UX76_C0020G0003 [Candidatus Wolfebacteria bacterium GW2011_GWC1_47_103]KKU59418.1 MAG: hypothetical protein UX83_C0005G0037 [Candidatus Wolfebacteria bacterium GW2011_GWE2_47_12]KKU65546.1 MAG: hypothetical protein UX90_C0003G0008 [Candidatus Wolfebacteria